MKKEELKNIADEITFLQIKAEKTSDPMVLEKLEQEIANLCEKITTLEDLFILDDLIYQQILIKVFIVL